MNITNIKLYQNGNWVEYTIDPSVLNNGQEWVESLIGDKVDYLGVVKDANGLSKHADVATPGDYYRAGADFVLTGSKTEQVHTGDILICKQQLQTGDDNFNTSDYWDVIHFDQAIINIEDASGNNSIQTRGYGAEVEGEGSAYIGGIRYDDFTEKGEIVKDATKAIIAETAKQSFAAGGGIQIYGDWSVGFNKETSVYQRGAAAFGGGSKAGRTEEEFNRYFWSAFDDNDYKKPDPEGEPLHGGGYLTKDGEVTDTENRGNNDSGQRIGRTYDKAYSFAFATGEVTQALGRASFTAGSATKAIADYSAAFGYNTQAEGTNSFIIGKNGFVTGSCAFKAGEGGDASGYCSAAFGFETNASGNNSFAGGLGTIASGNESFAYGHKWNAKATEAKAYGSIALGEGCVVNEGASNSLVGGVLSVTENTDGRQPRTSFGYGEALILKDNIKGAFGYYNDPDVEWDKKTPLFTIGNGTSAKRSNALTVFTDGRVAAGANATQDNELVRLGQLDSFLVSKGVAYKSDLNSYVLTNNFSSLLDVNEVAYKTDIKNYTAADGGGIEIDDDNKITLSEDFLSYLDEQTYKSPSISTFELFYNNTKVTSTSVEVGQTVYFNAIKHKETNIGNITDNLILRKGNSDDDIIKEDITPSDAANPISVSITSQSISNTSAGSKSIKLEGTNSRDGNFSKAISIKFYWPQFYRVTTDVTWGVTEDDIKDATRRAEDITGSDKNCTITIPVGGSQYVYFRFVSRKRITMNGIDVDFSDDENGVKKSLDINGNDQEYYCYRTAKKLTPGTYIFNIVDKV